MQELMATLPRFGGTLLAVCFLIFGILYVFSLFAKHTRLKKLEEEASLRSEELSLGCESLFFHVPFNNEKKETVNAQ